MNQGDHETTTTPWEHFHPVDDEDYLEKRIISTVEGCPYEIIQIVRLTRRQLRFSPDSNLEQVKFQQEMEARVLQSDRIFHIKKLTMSQPVHDWGLEEWIAAAPFLFNDSHGKPLDEKLLNDEEMQEKRDTWR